MRWLLIAALLASAGCSKTDTARDAKANAYRDAVTEFLSEARAGAKKLKGGVSPRQAADLSERMEDLRKRLPPAPEGTHPRLNELLDNILGRFAIAEVAAETKGDLFDLGQQVEARVNDAEAALRPR